MRPRVKLGNVTPRRAVSADKVALPSYAATGTPFPSQHAAGTAVYKNKDDMDCIRFAAGLARDALEFSLSLVEPGVTTDEIDAKTHEYIVEHLQAYPSPLGYILGPNLLFPKSICTSVNDVLVHGVPDDSVLREGDLVSIDVSIMKNGFHGDNCATIAVGQVDEGLKKLVDTAEEAVLNAVKKACYPGMCVVDVSNAIEDVVKSNDLITNDFFCGHGVGRYLHELPFIHSTVDSATRFNAKHDVFEEDMVFTIEPALLETPNEYNGLDSADNRHQVLEDGITCVSVNGSYSAQFEHQVRITPDGGEILSDARNARRRR